MYIYLLVKKRKHEVILDVVAAFSDDEQAESFRSILGESHQVVGLEIDKVPDQLTRSALDHIRTLQQALAPKVDEDAAS